MALSEGQKRRMKVLARSNGGLPCPQKQNGKNIPEINPLKQQRIDEMEQILSDASPDDWSDKTVGNQLEQLKNILSELKNQ